MPRSSQQAAGGVGTIRPAAAAPGFLKIQIGKTEPFQKETLRHGKGVGKITELSAARFWDGAQRRNGTGWQRGAAFGAAFRKKPYVPEKLLKKRRHFGQRRAIAGLVDSTALHLEA